MKDMKKWLREHWLIVLVFGVVLAVFFVSRYTGIKKYNRKLKAKDDFIERLISEYEALEDSARAARRLAESYEKALAVYMDSLNDSRIKYINQNKRYVEELANLRRIPTDEHYRNLTEWLDSLSIHWNTGEDDGPGEAGL